MFKAILAFSFLFIGFQSSAAGKIGSTHGVYNLHDVTDSIKRGGRVNAEGMKYLADLGTKTIINLEFEESAVAWDRAEAAKYGIRFIHKPMDYLTAPTDAQIDELLGLLQDPKNFPIYIHCHFGKDRTGTVIGIYNVEVLGWTPERAFQDMLDKGFSRFLRELENYFRGRTGLKLKAA